MENENSRRLTELERAVDRHLAGCEEQNKNVTTTLARLESAIGEVTKGVTAGNAQYMKFIMILLGAEGAALLAIFAAWLKAQGGH